MFASQFLPRFVTTGIFAAFISLGGGDAANALYDVGPGEIPGKPGTIIRVWPLEGGGPGMGGNGDAFRVLYRSTDPWKGIMLRNTPGQAPAGAPVFLAQGTADTTVEPEITKRFGEALCAQGVRVSFVPLPGVTHTFAARDSANAALNWLTERFRGAPAPSSCVR